MRNDYIATDGREPLSANELNLVRRISRDPHQSEVAAGTARKIIEAEMLATAKHCGVEPVTSSASQPAAAA